MKDSTKKIKTCVFGVLVISLFIPTIQKQFGVFNEKILSGFFDTETFPAFSDSLFKEGVFQEKFEKAATDNVGLHNFFVRLQNQLNYSLYNISKTSSVIIGKNGYLFDKSYVNGYNGDDFVGKASIDLQIEKAKVVQKEFNRKHIDLLFAFAPGKGSFFSEYIPDKYLCGKNIDSSNYMCYIKACAAAKLNVIDLRKYFLSIKDTVKHPLFSQVGVHWSDYGAFLAADTIAKKIGEIKKIKLTPFKITGFEYIDTIKIQDRDEEKMMNVFSVLPHYNMAFLKIGYLNDSSAVKPNVLTIADSYYSTIVATNVVDSIFSGWSYWLYKNRISSDKNKKIDLKSEIEKRDVILLLGTDATLGQFPYAFIDEAYELYAPKNKNYYALKDKEFRLSVYQTFDNIENNKTWKKLLIKSAKENGVSETVQFFNAAVWCYKETQAKNKKISMEEIFFDLLNSENNSYILSKTVEYGAALKKNISDLPDQTKKIIVSGKMVDPENNSKDALVVLVVEDVNGKNIIWEGKPFHISTDSAGGKIVSVRFDLDIESFKPNNIFKAYVWNKGKKDFSLIDCKIGYWGMN